MFSYVLLIGASSAWAGSDWSVTARQEIPDRIGVEITLDALNVNASEASYLGGHTRWHSDAVGQTYTDHQLQWLRLDGASVIDPPPSARQEGCAQIAGRDPVPGNRTLHIYRSTPTADDSATAIALNAQPGVVLASTEAGEVALVALRPGDQVTLVEAEHVRKGNRAERLELRRDERRLVLDRNGTNPRACFGVIPEEDR